MIELYASLVSRHSMDGLKTLAFSENVSGAGRYLIIQRDPDTGSTYLEIDRPVNGARDAVGDIKIEQGQLTLRLIKPAGTITDKTVQITFPRHSSAVVEYSLAELFGN